MTRGALPQHWSRPLMRKYVTCPNGHRNDRTGGRRKCSFEGCGLPLRKSRGPKHAATLREDGYETYATLSQAIHASERDACAVCGRPKPGTRRHDRDHDHRTGKARGLACVRCNRELLRNGTLEEARLVVAYLERVESFYGVTVDG